MPFCASAQIGMGREKILKNVRDISVYNFVWLIVAELTCQLLAHVGHSYFRMVNGEKDDYYFFIILTVLWTVACTSIALYKITLFYNQGIHINKLGAALRLTDLRPLKLS